MDPTWRMRMQTLTMRMKNMEIGEKIDKSLYQYYVVERGEDVPNWRCVKDPDWWKDYLRSLGIDSRNP